MNRRNFLRCITYSAGVAAASYGVGWGLYNTQSFTDEGRTENGLVTAISGILANKVYGDCDIDLSMEKTFAPDGKISGRTTKDQVNAVLDVPLTSVKIVANKNSKGYFDGEVEKAEFDWKIKQKSEDSYEIIRWGPKLNYDLELIAKDGVIKGTVKRKLSLDWDIEGRYDAEGNVEYELQIPLRPNISVKGKIKKRK